MSTHLLTVTALAAAVALGRYSAAHTIRRLRSAYERALAAADLDDLTGLPNRARARRDLRDWLATGGTMVVALVDLDRFKHVNDLYGHHAGDQVLRHVAGLLEAACWRDGGRAYRLGGDEFLLVLPTFPGLVLRASTGDATASVASLLDEVVRPVVITASDGRTVTVTPSASVGVAAATTGAWQELLLQADIALLQAKASRGRGRGRVPARMSEAATG